MTPEQARIKLDIDGGKLPDLWTLWRRCQRAGVKINWLSQVRSPSGKGWHLVLDVSPRPASAMEVVALQAVLGGDLWREAMQVCRARAFPRVPRFMQDAWNVLYRYDYRRARHLVLERG